MFDSERPEAYESVYGEIVGRLASADLEGNAAALGLEWRGGEAFVKLYGRGYLVGPDGVRAEDGSEAPVAHRIVLALFLLHGGRGEPAGVFVPYRELRGGCDFSRNLAITVEGRIARAFARRIPAIERAALELGGARTDPGVKCDVAYAVEAVPKVPIMFTFYDEDEDFPAEVKVFYDKAALDFLDLECLAVLGMILALELEVAAERKLR